MASERLFVKVERDMLPRVVDRFPFLYLEYGRLEVDDSSVKWLDAEGNRIRLPIATIMCLILGPGTTITHDAVRTIASTNCNICWAGEDSLLFYAASFTPTATTTNLLRQVEYSADKRYALLVAKAMFAKRFSSTDLAGKSLEQLKGMEGIRVKQLYENYAQKYGVGWKGRQYVPGKIELSDVTNKYLTTANAFLYGILASVIHGLGYDPRIGFVHASSPLPFVYDLADLYKENMSIDLAFYLTKEMGGRYDKDAAREDFTRRATENNLLKTVVDDINELVGEKSGRNYSKQIA